MPSGSLVIFSIGLSRHERRRAVLEESAASSRISALLGMQVDALGPVTGLVDRAGLATGVASHWMSLIPSR
jgi:hypothetical protein